jgi:hypothetical protein
MQTTACNRDRLFIFGTAQRNLSLYQQRTRQHESRNQTGHAILGPTRPEILQPCHSPHFMAPFHPPIICRAKAIAPSALDFFYVSCRLLTRPRLASFLLPDHILVPPLLPGTVTAALVPSRGQTALHRPAPSGVRAGHGTPGHLPIGSGRLGVRVAHLDPFPGHIPARLRPLGYRQKTHGSGRLGS